MLQYKYAKKTSKEYFALSKELNPSHAKHDKRWSTAPRRQTKLEGNLK